MKIYLDGRSGILGVVDFVATTEVTVVGEVGRVIRTVRIHADGRVIVEDFGQFMPDSLGLTRAQVPPLQAEEGHEHRFVADPDRPDHHICQSCGLPA